MYQLKQLPEDFRVKEIPLVKPSSRGKYLYFRLKKKNRNTLEVVQEIARKLHIPEKQVGFAGSKDKKAITEQVCSILGVSKERLSALMIQDVEIRFLGYGNEPIPLGDLQGNKFEIVVRNLDEQDKLRKVKFIPNYFDEQRFGKNNAAIGKALLKKEFERAIKLINHPFLYQHLQQHPRDFIGALKLLPIRQLRLYLNAYQSYLWNEMLAEYLRRHAPMIQEVPYSLGKLVFVEDSEEFAALEILLIGFDSGNVKADQEIKELMPKLMEKEDIAFNDFIIRQIPQLTLEGELRKGFVEVQGLTIGRREEDEFHPGKKKVKLAFSLPKGSYATMAVKQSVADDE